MASRAIDARTQTIMNHYTNLFCKRRQNFPHIKDIILMKNADGHHNWEKWYVIIHNLKEFSDKFKDVELILVMEMAKTVPHEPPSIKFLTETGIFNPGDNICLSVGVFHRENYSPSLGIVGYANMVVQILPFYKDLKNGGIGIKIKDEATIAKCLANSKRYNLINNYNILMNIEDPVLKKEYEDEYAKYMAEIQNKKQINSQDESDKGDKEDINVIPVKKVGKSAKKVIKDNNGKDNDALSVSKEAEKAAKEAEKAAKEAEKAAKEAEKAAKEAEKEAERIAKEEAKAAREAEKEAERVAKAEAKAAREAEKEAERIAKEEAKAAKEEAKAAKEAERIAKAEAKAEAKASKQKKKD